MVGNGIQAGNGAMQPIVVRDAHGQMGGAAVTALERDAVLASTTAVRDDLARILGADHLTDVGPLVVELNDRVADMSPYAESKTNSLHFGTHGMSRGAATSGAVAAHEGMHLALNRTLGAPTRTSGTMHPAQHVGGAVDAGIREGLSDVAGALHERTWRLAAGDLLIRDLGTPGAGYATTATAERRARIAEAIVPPASPAPSNLLRDKRIDAAHRLFEAHAGGAPVSSAFHGVRELGWTRTEQLFGGTVNELARTSKGAPLTYAAVGDAMRAAAQPLGDDMVAAVAKSLLRVRL